MASSVGDQGVIIDVGTAQGGSAAIFFEAARGRQIAIHTCDPQPSDEAYRHLAGTDVEIVATKSTAYAARWQGPPVDLLFIDGSHHLQDVIDDFNEWAPHLAPSATVAFHDYDSVERGGLIHLGVKVAVDALLSRQLLADPTRAGRILSGVARRGTVDASDCRAAADQLRQRFAALVQRDYSDWQLLGQAGPLYELLTIVLPLRNARRVDAASAPDVLAFGRPLGEVTSGFEVLDSVTFCYLLEAALATRRSAVIELTANRKAFFKWEEVLATLDHATGGSYSIAERYSRSGTRTSLSSISSFVALEQVRLVCLARMFHAVTGYEL